jgi:probable HAF family extracellular repeat protein
MFYSVAAEYELIDLGTLGGTKCRPYDINDEIQIVGYSSTPGDQDEFAFIWDEVNGMVSLGTLDGNVRADARDSLARAINNLGQVVGTSIIDTPGEPYRAFIWEDTTGMLAVSASGYGDDVVNSEASDISEVGHIVLYSESADTSVHSWILEGGVATNLGNLGGPFSVVSGVNVLAQAAGLGMDGVGNVWPFEWESGIMSPLGNLSNPDSEAKRINNLGQAVGNAPFPPQSTQSFVWDAVNGMEFLNSLTTAANSAMAVNDVGQIVGGNLISGLGFHAYVWNDGVMTDLNDVLPPSSGWELFWATGINNYGDIVGYGSYNGQVPRAYLLKANPGQPRNGFYRDLFDIEWPLMAADLGLQQDAPNTPGTHIPERWGLMMVSTVLTNAKNPHYAPTIQTYYMNLQALSAEDQTILDRVEPYKHVLAAALLINPSRRDYFVGILGLANSYEIVRELSKLVNDEIYADDGDLDGDGLTNQEEYDLVLADGGTILDFAAAATDPTQLGAKSLPIRIQTLGLLLLLFVIVGTTRIRKDSRKTTPV